MELPWKKQGEERERETRVKKKRREKKESGEVLFEKANGVTQLINQTARIL